MVKTNGNRPRTDLSRALESAFAAMSLPVARAADRALAGHDLSLDEVAALFEAPAADLPALAMAADELRRRTVGDIVTYVVNRNINFTNVCIKRCGFCAFSRDHRTEEGYFLPISEVVRRAKEAWELGATEVCIQAGLPPKMDGDLYIRIAEAIKAEVPDLHLHAFSPEEVLYGAVRARCNVEEYLRRLKAAGVGSLPGTSAEILDDSVRRRISPGRISTADWVKVITTAHKVGIPTTATIMYGHIETPRQRAAHLCLLRDIQKATGGITEFVPLSFVHSEAPMYGKKLVPGVRAGATAAELMAMYAVSRLTLNNYIRNLQVSWVKEGPRLAQMCLTMGANDFSGTLINESISTSAGAANGQLVRPAEFRHLIRDMGRVPAERTTLYEIRRVFDDPAADPVEPLDLVESPEERFGTYDMLVRSGAWRYEGMAAPVA